MLPSWPGLRCLKVVLNGRVLFQVIFLVFFVSSVFLVFARENVLNYYSLKGSFRARFFGFLQGWA